MATLDLTLDTGRTTMNPISTELIAAGSFGVTFIVAVLVLAVFFPRPSPFQYTVFRIILAIAVAGIAPFIPGFLEVNVNNFVKAGGAIAVFVIIYFFSPAKLIANSPAVGLPVLVQAWEGIRAPDPNNLNQDMAHRAINAMKVVSWYWRKGTSEEKSLIRSEAFTPFQQWFSVLDSVPLLMSDGKSSKAHLDGELRSTYEEMKAHA